LRRDAVQRTAPRAGNCFESPFDAIVSLRVVRHRSVVEELTHSPPEFVAQGDRVLIVGEYIDTQALAWASEMDASGLA
jgi:hypothetical protein